jgi:hypothetical protein
MLLKLLISRRTWNLVQASIGIGIQLLHGVEVFLEERIGDECVLIF